MAQAPAEAPVPLTTVAREAALLLQAMATKLADSLDSAAGSAAAEVAEVSAAGREK